jgi:hypothetical protein
MIRVFSEIARRCILWAAPGLLLLTSAIPARAQDIQYVLQISVDGLHAGQLQALLLERPDEFANFRRFVTEGATTFNARTDYFSTVTLPNHTSMITGRPVRQPADDPTLHHGYLGNVTPKPADTLHNSGNPLLTYVASTFDQIHDHNLSTALYTGKDKFVIYEQSYNVTPGGTGGRPDAFLDDGDQGVNKIDRYEFEVVKGTSSGIIETMSEDYHSNPFNYSFVHLLEPDSSGHAYGWRSQEWNDSVKLVDQHLGRIFEFVETEAQLNGHTAIVLTSDHGGSLLTHDHVNDPNVFRIPFFVWGPGVAAGSDLYQLNELTRLDPGQSRPTYIEALQPIRNGDSANLVLSLLGLPPVEGSSINARQDLQVGLPREVRWDGVNPQVGQSGDGQSWLDPRNWSRGEVVDRSPMAGDILSLPSNNGPQMISLEGERPLHSMSVDGDYQLTDGSVALSMGDVLVAADKNLTIRGALSGPRGIIKSGGGTLTVDSIDVSDLLVSDGSIVGPLVVGGSLASRGVIEPGGNQAIVHVHGDYAQAATGTLRLQLSGDGTNDQLVVDGRAIYRGTLALQTGGADLDPDSPGESVRWTLVTTARRLGNFTTVTYNGQPLTFDPPLDSVYTQHAGDGLFRRLAYNNQSLTWTHYRAFPGDANGDELFDTQDLVSVFAIGGYENGVAADAQWTSGDWDGDGDFTSSDMVAAFVTGRFEAPVMAVPEPGGSSLLLSSCCLLYLAKGRRTRY